MGLFSFAQKAGESLREAVTGGGAPSETELRTALQQNGITIQNLDLDVKGDTVRISGVADTNAEREKAILVLGNRKDVDQVDDDIRVLQPRRANLARRSRPPRPRRRADHGRRPWRPGSATPRA